MTNAQLTIDGDELDDQLHAETTGRTIRPFRRLIDPVVDEFKLRADPDGLHVTAVDAANVSIIDVTLPADALDAYDVTDGGTVLGVNSSALGSALSDARYGKSTDDPVELTADDATLETRVERDYSDMAATVTDRTALIDPDSIRQQPDIPTLDGRIKVDVPPQAFIDIINSFDRTDYIEIDAREDTVAFRADEDTFSRSVELAAGSETRALDGSTVFSKDYLKAFASGLSSGYAESATLALGEELPLSVEFETESGAYGEYLVAPRIQSE